MNKEMGKLKYFICTILLTILFLSIFIGGYFVYSINFRGMNITNVGKIQDNYPQYMVDINDEFIGYMLEFEKLLEEPQREYSEEELKAISDNLEKQNNVMIKLQKTPPNGANKDYLGVYKDYLKLYAFYIQGEVMRVEYVSAYRNQYTQEEIQNGLSANEETYVIGIELCNMMGTLILENPIIVNKVHNTNADSIYDVINLEEWKESVSEKIEEYEKENGVIDGELTNNKTPINQENTIENSDSTP